MRNAKITTDKKADIAAFLELLLKELSEYDSITTFRFDESGKTKIELDQFGGRLLVGPYGNHIYLKYTYKVDMRTTYRQDQFEEAAKEIKQHRRMFK